MAELLLNAKSVKNVIFMVIYVIWKTIMYLFFDRQILREFR